MFCSNCGAGLAPAASYCAACGGKVGRDASTVIQPELVSLEKSLADLPPPLPPAKSSTDMPPPLPPKTPADIPAGVKGWSWGAFLLNWIWAIGNRTWIGLLALVPYLGLIVAIWLGIKGREMAWKNKEWNSVEHFDRVQKKWSRWAVGITLVFIPAFAILAAIAVPAYEDYTARAVAMQQDTSLDNLLEQAAEASTTTHSAPPTAQEVPAEKPIGGGGSIDSNGDDLPASLPTVAGTLTRMNDQDGNRVMALDGKALFGGYDANWQFPVRSFTLSGGRQAVLMASSGGRGNSCETLFFFLLANPSGVRATPLFGTCSPVGSFEQRGDRIALTLPGMDGQSTVVLDGDTIVEDGELVAMNDTNNPAN